MASVAGSFDPLDLVPIRGLIGVSSGRNFLFIDTKQAGTDPDLKHLLSIQRGNAVLPLWGCNYSTAAGALPGHSLSHLQILSISTDKDVYREGEDRVTILIIDPTRPDADIDLEVKNEGRQHLSPRVHLDWNGMGTYVLSDLPVGRYSVSEGTCQTSFEVARYELTGLTGSVKSAREREGLLDLELSLSTHSRAVSGRVRVIIREGDRIVHGPLELDSIGGVVRSAFPLSGKGPFVAHVTGIDDPGLDTQIPLLGTERSEREQTWISRLGAQIAAAVLPRDRARANRGLWLWQDGTNNAPLSLEEPVADVARMTAQVRLEHVMLSLLHPGEGRIAHRRVGSLEPQQILEFGTQPPFTVACVGALVSGRPWEGVAVLLPPTEIGLKVQGPKEAVPRAAVSLTLSTARPSQRVSVFLVVRDARIRPADHPMVQLGAALKSAIQTYTHPEPPPTGQVVPRPPSPGPGAAPGGRAGRGPGGANPRHGGPGTAGPREAPYFSPTVATTTAVGPGKRKLGEALIAGGFINKEQLQQAIARQKQTGQRLGPVLVEMRVVTERDLAEVWARQLNLPFIDLSNYVVDPGIAKLVHERIALRHQLIPINKVGNTLTVAMADPLNVLALDDVQLMTGLQVKAVVATTTDVQNALAYIHGELPEVSDMLGGLAGADIATGSTKLDDLEEFGALSENDAPVIRLVNLILRNAVKQRATEILIEPLADRMSVFYQINEIRHQQMDPPKKAQPAITVRLKAMFNLDIAECANPQEGTVEFSVDQQTHRLRLITVPTPHGERFQIRLLPQSGEPDAEGPGGPGIPPPSEPPEGRGGPPSGRAREVFPEVLFAGQLSVRGELELTLALSDSLGSFEIDAIALCHGGWEQVTSTLEVTRKTFVQMYMPACVFPGDAVTGRLDVGWESLPVEIELTRDGSLIPLVSPKGPFTGADMKTAGCMSFSFPAGPGRYECTIHEPGRGVADASAKDVLTPGVIRALQRQIRILQPGETVTPESLKALSLGVLPGPKRPLANLCKVTAGYTHLCCEQTASKVLAATQGYLLATNEADQSAMEGIIASGVLRLRSLWIPGKGLKAYPNQEVPNQHLSRQALDRLSALSLLSEGRSWPAALAALMDELGHIRHHLEKIYEVPERPTRLERLEDLYRAAVHRSLGPEALLGSIVRNRYDDPAGLVASGAPLVETRAGASIAAAALLRGGRGVDLRLALRLADWVGQQRSASGAFYSTWDSSAAILMFHELDRLLGTGGGGTVRINGRSMTLEQAANVSEDIESVEAGSLPVILEVSCSLEQDWAQYQSNLPVVVRLEPDGTDDGRRSPKRYQLVVELERYHDGDLVHVCLPPALARIHGGGRLQAFAVDFEGRSRLKIPVACLPEFVAGPATLQHYFVCVRNMYAEERIGNPGILAMAIDAAPGS